MPNDKSCPVCGSSKWNYDVVTLDCEKFCGDCFKLVKKIGNELGLTIWNGCGTYFASVRDFRTAIKAAQMISNRETLADIQLLCP